MKGSLKTFGDVRFSVTHFQAAFYLNYSIRFQAALWIRLTLARASIGSLKPTLPQSQSPFQAAIWSCNQNAPAGIRV